MQFESQASIHLFWGADRQCLHHRGVQEGILGLVTSGIVITA